MNTFEFFGLNLLAVRKKTLFMLGIMLASCMADYPKDNLNLAGKTIRERVRAPHGYQWVEEQPGTFGYFLQNIALKKNGSRILDYSGTPISNQSEHLAILNYDVGTKDLQQCADAVIRLRAEYLYKEKRYDEIAFHFTSGHLYKWSDYRKGIRPIIKNNNKVSFAKTAKPDDSYEGMRKYLDIVYQYAGTISLNAETKPVKHDKMLKAGDILITPGSPGHVVIIVGRATNEGGENIFLLAEGYTPAQSIHIITNPFKSTINPWYALSTKDFTTITARYSFLRTNLRQF